MKKLLSTITAAVIMLTAFSIVPSAGAASTNAADYTYTITPILSPFNEYFFVKTDNPDPFSFRFADKSTIYADSDYIAMPGSSGSITLYADVNYEDTSTGRVNGGYIFRSNSYNTDGGEIVLQTKSGSTWTDTSVKYDLPALRDNVDYLIDTYAVKSEFFDNMSAVQSGFSDICLYSGSNIRGQLYKKSDYWYVQNAGHIDQSYYIISPYGRSGSESLFATAVYPYRYDSLGFPSMMGQVAKRLDSSATYAWNSGAHYLVDVTYNGTTKSYGGQGSHEGQGISKDKISQYFSFGTNGTNVTLSSTYDLLVSYSNIKMDDDIPREDSLTWKGICDVVGEGAWARMYGTDKYTYFFTRNNGTSFSADEWGVGYSIYWGGDLGYLLDTWVDGRYIGNWRYFVKGETFANHSTSKIYLRNVTVPQIKYKRNYKYDLDTQSYTYSYTIGEITEVQKDVLYNYNSDGDKWTASYNAFDSGCADYNVIKQLVENKQLDQKYLDMVTITRSQAENMDLDKNTNTLPAQGFSFDGKSAPGTPFTNSTALRGDINNDGKITIDDATKLQRYIARIDSAAGDETFTARADVNGDGNVNIVDVTEIQRYLAGCGNPHKIGEAV